MTCSLKGTLAYKVHSDSLHMQKSTIALSIETKNRLRSFGEKDQSYDELVNVILDRHEYGDNH